MKKHGKKLISILLIVLIMASVVITGIVSSFAEEVAPPNPNRLPEYTPSAGVETINVNFAMPAYWMGEEGSEARSTWEKYGSTAGIYWWGSIYNPDDAPDAAGHGWPGWKMKKDEYIDNLYTSSVPKETSNLIFTNFIDGGLDTSYPEYDASQLTKDIVGIEYLGQGDTDYYPLEFWNYIYDNYFDSFAENADFSIAEFGDYAKSFFYSEDYDSLFHYIDDMVFVVDYDTVRMQVSPVSGKSGFDGAFYFYYGNGEFGIWPTRELCIEMENIKTDAYGDVLFDKETLDENTDFIIREHTDAYDCYTKRDFVVFGNFTGKYSENMNPSYESATVPATDGYPEVDEPDATVSGNSIGFYANRSFWKNYKTITCYIYEHGGDELITWGSKKGNMDDTGNDIWAFDLDKKGITLESGKQYGAIFTGDWGVQTCDIIFDSSCLGKVAYLTGNMGENSIDSNKKSWYVLWNNGADRTKYAPPVCITSIGNIVGEAFWQGDTPESLFTTFLTSDGMDGIRNAVKYNGKNIEQTAYDTGHALGLTDKQITDIAKKYGYVFGGGTEPSDPYNPSYDNEDAMNAAEYVLDNMGKPNKVTPAKLKQMFDLYEVTPDEVDEALFNLCAYDYADYKSASELVRKADSAYMDIIKGDVNRDGTVDILDATWIQKYAAERITSFDEIP